ncbi:MAG TPA: proton-conducting transporter membrane subunit [Aestuariivirga sp.]|nr:proton-conducting transporter membrane subunit [Aestuariivirga sp.]
MVSALLLIALPLAAAFLLGLISNRHIAYALTLAAMAAGAAVSGWWVWQLGWAGAVPVDILTAGTAPPFAINLRMGLAESVLALTITLTGLLAAIYLKDTLLAIGQRAMAVVMIAVMAYCGIVLTRHLFNLFVFFELAAIATAGLILLSDDALALGAGFKYLVVSQIISALLLVGIIFAYHGTGNLNIDGMAAVTMGRVGGSLAIAFFLIFIAIVAELKPFPANGWALDIYESAHPAFSALFSAAAGTATLYAADKLLAIGGPGFLPKSTGIGILGFP